MTKTHLLRLTDKRNLCSICCKVHFAPPHFSEHWLPVSSHICELLQAFKCLRSLPYLPALHNSHAPGAVCFPFLLLSTIEMDVRSHVPK